MNGLIFGFRLIEYEHKENRNTANYQRGGGGVETPAEDLAGGVSQCSAGTLVRRYRIAQPQSAGN